MKESILIEDLNNIFNTNIDWQQFHNKSVLITGAYGMLASYLVYFFFFLREIKNINVRIIALVRNRDKFYKRFGQKISGALTLIESDLSNPLDIEESIDYIIHAASLASPQYYSVCPVDVLSPNVLGTYNLLKLAVDKRIKGFLLFSTGDVYGRVDTAGAISEDTFGWLDTLDIHNCYSESKRMAETICKAFAIQYNVPIRIARIFHTYSPTMDIKNDPRVFASFVANIVNNEDIVMKSDGSGKRSFCYITDAVTAFMTILLKGENMEAYNVCNESQFVSIAELAEVLVNLFPEKKLKVIKKERKKEEHYTENSLMAGGKYAMPSNNKLKKLGWEPIVDIKNGFEKVIKSFC